MADAGKKLWLTKGEKRSLAQKVIDYLRRLRGDKQAPPPGVPMPMSGLLCAWPEGPQRRGRR
jgi:hypothetical protein